jgi:hypothetical protein
MLETLLAMLFVAMILYYPVKAMIKNKQYKYVTQLDGTEKVVELV